MKLRNDTISDDGNSQESWRKRQELAGINRDKLLNEQMVQYKVNKEDVVSSGFKEKFNKYEAPQLSKGFGEKLPYQSYLNALQKKNRPTAMPTRS
mmetsp:Transcript_20171/g.19124  ORF Transcript_20171/g.19124 Transcript_20171/m.19124 type:complete len:95 (-) Transcript_20171:387-671(-)